MSKSEEPSSVFIVSPAAFASQFSGAFDAASKRAKTFDAEHQAQVEQLGKLVEALNHAGNFTAEIGNLQKSAARPELMITHKASGGKISYLIGFGAHPVDEACTMTFSRAGGKLVGNKAGYDLLNPGDASMLAVDLAADMAQILNKKTLCEKATAHLKQGGK